MNFIRDIQEIAKKHSAECKTNESMKNHTTFKIGGTADVFVKVNNEQVLAESIIYCKSNNVPYFILGKGSDLLVSDEGIRGVVMHMGTGFDEVIIYENRLICKSGASMTQIAATALKYGLTGFEFAYGIPGSIGGGVYMNAGAYGSEIKDVFISSRHINQKGELCEFSKEEACLSYRHSAYSDKNYCIISSTLELAPGNPALIKEKMQDLMKRRTDKQPLDYPSAGSTFKRPEGYFAAALIEECGLKGFTIGGAMISTKHSGFVVNTGNATALDVIKLTEEVKRIVFEKKGVVLQLEVKKIGF